MGIEPSVTEYFDPPENPDPGHLPNSAALLTVKVHSHEHQHLRLHVRLRQDDNIVSMRTLRQTQRMGSAPIHCV